MTVGTLHANQFLFFYNREIYQSFHLVYFMLLHYPQQQNFRPRKLAY